MCVLREKVRERERGRKRVGKCMWSMQPALSVMHCEQGRTRERTHTRRHTFTLLPLVHTPVHTCLHMCAEAEQCFVWDSHFSHLFFSFFPTHRHTLGSTEPDQANGRCQQGLRAYQQRSGIHCEAQRLASPSLPVYLSPLIHPSFPQLWSSMCGWRTPRCALPWCSIVPRELESLLQREGLIDSPHSSRYCILSIALNWMSPLSRKCLESSSSLPLFPLLSVRTGGDTTRAWETARNQAGGIRPHGYLRLYLVLGSSLLFFNGGILQLRHRRKRRCTLTQDLRLWHRRDKDGFGMFFFISIWCHHVVKIYGPWRTKPRQTSLELSETVVGKTLHLSFDWITSWCPGRGTAIYWGLTWISTTRRSDYQGSKSNLAFSGIHPFPLQGLLPLLFLIPHPRWYQPSEASCLLCPPPTEVLHRPGWVGRGVAHGTPRHLGTADPPKTVDEAAVLGRWPLLQALLFASAGRSRTPRRTGRLPASASPARRATSHCVRSRSSYWYQKFGYVAVEGEKWKKDQVSSSLLVC